MVFAPIMGAGRTQTIRWTKGPFQHFSEYPVDLSIRVYREEGGAEHIKASREDGWLTSQERERGARGSTQNMPSRGKAGQAVQGWQTAGGTG